MERERGERPFPPYAHTCCSWSWLLVPSSPSLSLLLSPLQTRDQESASLRNIATADCHVDMWTVIFFVAQFALVHLTKGQEVTTFTPELKFTAFDDVNSGHIGDGETIESVTLTSAREPPPPSPLSSSSSSSPSSSPSPSPPTLSSSSSIPSDLGRSEEKPIKSCPANWCENGASCSLNNYDEPECSCPIEYKGNKCQYQSFCHKNPCQNNASCIEDTTSASYSCSCPIGFGGINCQIACPPFYTGLNCTTKVDVCANFPCLNGGTCRGNESSNGFTCLCKKGFRGDKCGEDIDECTELNPCINGICINTIGSYMCYCTPGFNGKHCGEDIDECLSNPCKNNGTCNNLQATYSCDCPLGYSGDSCEINTDECSSSPCKNNGLCIDGIANFTCKCADGFRGDLCEENINECSGNPCLNNGTCHDGIADYFCNCSGTGYEGKNCQDNVNDCIPNSCMNGGTCQDEVKGFKCLCHPGYTGNMCETDLNDCSPDNPCLNNGKCFERSKLANYHPSSLDSPLKNVLFNHSTASGFICACPPGFNGTTCEININECDSTPCMNGGTCIDAVNDFRCICPVGFFGDDCSREYNACDSNPCLHGGQCSAVRREKEFTCHCQPGFEGTYCEKNTDDCDPNPCPVGYICKDLTLNHSCECPPGFRGPSCSINIDECHENACYNNGQCIDGILGYSCNCPSGFTGLRCEEDVDECTEDVCDSGICLNTEGSFKCVCLQNGKVFSFSFFSSFSFSPLSFIYGPLSLTKIFSLNRNVPQQWQVCPGHLEQRALLRV